MATDETRVPETNRPYGPPSDVRALLARLRSRNLPDRIDSDYLRDSGISSGTTPRTLVALKFLGLIDKDGHPAEALRSIHTSTDDEYRKVLADVLRQAYADVFAVVDPAEDSPDQVLNVFRKYTPASQRHRMVIFFLGLCRDAGIKVTEAAAKPRPQTVRPETLRNQPRFFPPRVRQGPPKGMTGLPPALEALVRSLPEPGSPLSADQREKWLDMARAALVFLFPEEAGQSTTQEEVGSSS